MKPDNKGAPSGHPFIGTHCALYATFIFTPFP